MVTPSQRLRPAGLAGLARLAALVAALAVLAAARPAHAQEATVFFLTAKTGQQEVGGSLFKTLANNHGPLQENHTVNRAGFELDVYAVTRKKFGLAVGMEVMQFDKTFTFFDKSGVLPTERLRLDGRSFLYTLKGYLRFGNVLPFFGVGTGSYYVSYDEKVSKLSFLDVSTPVLAYRAGLRWLVAGHWALLAEGGEIIAPIHVTTGNQGATLELGGSFWNLGVSYAW
jgi:hypothetical protein